METLVTRYHWLQLTPEQRTKMRAVFNIPKSGGVEMMGNKIISDGSNESDLKVINIESMQEFLGSGYTSDTSFEQLYNMSIEKVDALLKADELALLVEAQQVHTKKRTQDIQDVVSSLLETIFNLPIDAQIQIKSALTHIGKQETETHVKTATKGKKVKEGSNKQGSEGTGSGSEETAGTS